jgi:hypothetical protein
MGDIVKDSFEKHLGQKKVVFQQQKPLLNYELNLLQDILNTHSVDLTKFSLGNNFYGDSFKVRSGNLPNEIFINKGIFYHEGVALFLSTDKRVSVEPNPVSGSRSDYVYVEYQTVEVDSPIDPLIGFVTTREEQLDFEVKISVGEYPVLEEEEISFTASNKTITLKNGAFPDWMRIENTQFTTTSSNNQGVPFLTVISSPSPNTIIVEQTLTTETLNDVRFRKFTPTLNIAREFRAYKNKFFIIARLNRFSDIALVSDIEDLRELVTYNYVISGCKVSHVADLDIAIEEGSLLVGKLSKFIEDDQPNLTLEDNSLNYVFVNTNGEVLTSLAEPTEFHVILAEVTTKNGTVVRIEDAREFTPISYANIFGSGGGTGETDFISITHPFKASENIIAKDAVYLSGEDTVGRASASIITRMPALGIATEDCATGQIDNVVTFGIISESSWNWTPGEVVYLAPSSGGLIKASQVSTFITNSQFVQRVGFAVSQTKLFVKPELMFIRKDTSAEIPLVVMRDNGRLEIMGPTDRLSPDRLNFLAINIIEGTTQFNILPGRYFVNSNISVDFSGGAIEIGISGTTYKPSAMLSNYYNKLYFTLDSNASVKMYQGVSASSLVAVSDPVIPSDEMPLGIVYIQDDGNGLGGSIIPLTRSNLIDKRPWLNLGSIDDAAFKAIYFNNTNILVTKGDAWFNKFYVTLPASLIVPINTTNASYYVYLNLNNVTGSQLNAVANSTCVEISTLTPLQIDRRKFVPLAQFNVSSGIVVRSSFKTYSSKFWEYRDSEFENEQIFSIESPVTGSVEFNLGYNFIPEDSLKITINGIEVYETKDYVKDASLNKVTFNYPVLTGAEVRIRKV